MSVDDQEQRSRKMCLLIHGVEENDSEKPDALVLNVINNDLGIANINITEIQRSHRLGPKKSQRNLRSSKMFYRPIIVRFSNYRTRQKVFSYLHIRTSQRNGMYDISLQLTSLVKVMSGPVSDVLRPKSMIGT